jgi:hypothetical protein
MLESEAYCLEAHPGILVVSEHQRRQRLPILGMRALAHNKLKISLEFANPNLGHLTIDTI